MLKVFRKGPYMKIYRLRKKKKKKKKKKMGGQEKPAKTAVSPCSSPRTRDFSGETNPAAKSKERRLFSQGWTRYAP